MLESQGCELSTKTHMHLLERPQGSLHLRKLLRHDGGLQDHGWWRWPYRLTGGRTACCVWAWNWLLALPLRLHCGTVQLPFCFQLGKALRVLLERDWIWGGWKHHLADWGSWLLPDR